MHPTKTQPHFFDDEGSAFSFKQVNFSKGRPSELSSQPLLISQLVCKDLSNGSTVTGIFGLHKTFLAYYGPNFSKSPKSYTDLAYSRIKPVSQTCNGFILTKNQSYLELTFSDKKNLDNWEHVLRQVCVLENFHEEYKAIKMIGRGSFGKVYLVESLKNGKSYAVKAFSKECILDTEKIRKKAALLNEIEILRALDHENIIKLYEVHESDSSIYLVMELVKGKSLEEVIKTRTIQSDSTGMKSVAAIKSILGALAYIASKGIMHRDLKPSNILVDEAGKIKIVDFGMATYINLPEYIFSKGGTPGYIAPEVFKFDPKRPSTSYNDRCDSFSVGCILFYMLFGRALYRGSSIDNILQNNRNLSESEIFKIIEDQINNYSTKISKDGLNLLRRLLEFDCQKRISAAEAVVHPFCNPPEIDVAKPSSPKVLVFIPLEDVQNEIQWDELLVSKRKTSETQSPMSAKSDDMTPTGERITLKDSLYLDVGKCEINGKTDSLSIGSTANNSIIISKFETIAPTTFSSFSQKAMLKDLKGKNQSQSFKSSTPKCGGQSLFKAAIFTNIRLKTDHEIGEAIPPSTVSVRASARKATSLKEIPPQFNDDLNEKSLLRNAEDGEEEINDIGDEDCDVGSQYKKFVSDSPKFHQNKLSLLTKS